jgi:hypothetical protein
LFSLVYAAMRFKENSLADSGIPRWISLEKPIGFTREIQCGIPSSTNEFTYRININVYLYNHIFISRSQTYPEISITTFECSRRNSMLTKPLWIYLYLSLACALIQIWQSLQAIKSRGASAGMWKWSDFFDFKKYKLFFS